MVTKDIYLGEFATGSVDRLRVAITKDGLPWNLSSATVTLTFEKPDRVTQFERAMTPESAVDGTFYYDTTTSDVDTVGSWTVGVKVVDAPVTKRYPYEISFNAVDEP